MAKYDITYSCGHTETIQLYGKHADRERYIKWASEHKVCSECRKADREALLAAAALFDIPSTLRRATWEWQGEEELDGDLWWEAHIADLILKDAAGRPFPVNVYGVAGLKD